MPFNQAGKSDPKNLFIPRACVEVALLGADDKPITGYRALGEVSNVNVTFEFQEAEKFSSCGEVRARIARVAIEQTADLTMTLDELLDYRNLELIFNASADIRAEAAPANTSQTYTVDLSDQESVSDGILIVPNPYYNGADPHLDAQVWGRSYQMWTASAGGSETIFAGPAPAGLTFERPAATSIAVPAWTPVANLYNVEADKISIEDADPLTGVPNATVLTGYTISALYGTIFIEDVNGTDTVKTKVNLHGAANPTVKWIKLSLQMANRSAAPVPLVSRLRALTRTSQLITLRLAQQNTNRSGWRQLTTIHKMRLIANGDFSFISDGTDFVGSELSGALERASWADPNVRGLEGWLTMEELKTDN